MILKAIEKAFHNAQTKNWERTYWAFDLHETILLPDWKAGSIPTEFYPMAKETMQLISKREDIVRIMYTCSHPIEINQYLEFFIKENIQFNYVNENPEVVNIKYGCYDKKPYFNVLFEDKAGFDPQTDWEIVYHYLLQNSK
ncbi:MAG: hypothetical protein U0U66_11740 [Cytophagaceae bacterium]